MALERGRLVLNKKGKPQIEIEGKLFNPAQGELSGSLLANLNDYDGKEVEFERVGGQPKKVREVGGGFIPPQPSVSARDPESDRPRGDRDGRPSGRGFQPGPPPERKERYTPPRERDFHNPYNFVPAPPRNTTDPDLGDQLPVAHDVFLEDRYSGSIQVSMIARTPLLVPDTEPAVESANGHKTFPLPVGADGKPLIPASSVRGMLRSAYETVTSSRFGCFSREQHSARLAFRMVPSEALGLVPARVEGGQIRLLTGTSAVGPDGSPNGPMYAAWLPQYDGNGQAEKKALRYADGSLPAHGDEVVCWLERMQHSKPGFEYWQVREIVRGSNPKNLGPRPAASKARGKTAPANRPDIRAVHGWVCVTNPSIKGKHDERVFFADRSGVPGPFPVTDAHRQMWRELIQNYQSIHEDDLRDRDHEGKSYDAYLGPEPGRAEWSRHVYTDADKHLSDGTLCYVRLNKEQSDVEALSRELYRPSPWDLLDPSLRPADTIGQLSPADRVFGWVKKVDADTESYSQDRRVAARGLLRVNPVRCESDTTDALEQFAPPGVPLAILSTPKPQQGRFYVAESPNGEAQPDGRAKADAGYLPGRGLRGRKVYPHQRSLPEGHWNHPTKDRTQQPHGSPAHYQEYRRPRKSNREEQRDSQNRSILGWVKPGAEFSFTLHVQNLSAVELGALLWILDLPENCFLRFGGAKPLGFGSVRLIIESLNLRTGKELRTRYDRWYQPLQSDDPKAAVVKAFQDAVVRAYPPGTGDFYAVPFIHAFLVACRGHKDDLPIHYPRATNDGKPGPPSPEGESFKWFVSNDDKGAGYALPDLANDGGLPTLPERSGGGGAGGFPRNQRRGSRHPRDRSPGGRNP